MQQAFQEVMEGIAKGLSGSAITLKFVYTGIGNPYTYLNRRSYWYIAYSRYAQCNSYFILFSCTD